MSAVLIRVPDSLGEKLELTDFKFCMEDHTVVNEQENLEKEE